jgi:glutaminyl-peptide cyclotransferase
LKSLQFDGERAMKYLKTFCDIGPRISGTEGIKKQQEIMIKHFEKEGAKVTKQEFESRQNSRKEKTPFTNLIASWHPEKTDRVLLCCHYDTRPIADQELNKLNWNKPFVSANDGTAGVAMLMELAHHMKDLKFHYGVDFAFFDGEEFIFTNEGPFKDSYFIGSGHFADQYAKNLKTQGFQYKAAILFDLCCHKDAVLQVEMHSYDAAKTIVDQVWGVAQKLKANSFRYERGTDVLDDHLKLIAVKIPAIDIIDSRILSPTGGGYTDWHKLSDTPDKVSPEQMKEVMTVVTTWLQMVK